MGTPLSEYRRGLADGYTGAAAELDQVLADVAAGARMGRVAPGMTLAGLAASWRARAGAVRPRTPPDTPRDQN